MWSPKRKMWTPRLKNVESKIAFGQLILGKIIKTVATRCQILRLKCTKIQNSAGALSQIPLGDLTALPQTPSWIQVGLLLTGGEGIGRDGWARVGRGREERIGECCGVQTILKIDRETYGCEVGGRMVVARSSRFVRRRTQTKACNCELGLDQPSLRRPRRLTSM